MLVPGAELPTALLGEAFAAAGHVLHYSGNMTSLLDATNQERAPMAMVTPYRTKDRSWYQADWGIPALCPSNPHQCGAWDYEPLPHEDAAAIAAATRPHLWMLPLVKVAETRARRRPAAEIQAENGPATLEGFSLEQIKMLGGEAAALQLIEDRNAIYARHGQATELYDWSRLAADLVDAFAASEQPTLTPFQRVQFAGARLEILRELEAATKTSLAQLVRNAAAADAGIKKVDLAAAAGVSRPTVDAWLKPRTAQSWDEEAR